MVSPLTEAEKAALAEIERVIVIGERLTYRDIARRLGISRGGVQLIERRALMKLQKLAKCKDQEEM